MKRKALFIGGTGTISMAITKLVATMPDWELTLLNRGGRNEDVPESVHLLTGDIRKENVGEVLRGMDWDVVADFIAFVPEHIETDFKLFNGHTKQFMFISSASTYAKPITSYPISESSPQRNPYSEYARRKIACEKLLTELRHAEGFPATIIRPTHTYDERKLPVAVRGNNGSWQVAKRMLGGKPVLIPGDGTSLWTLTHNTDFARAFVGLMGNAHAIGDTYQIMSDEILTWNQIHELIAQALGVELKPCYVPSSLLAYGKRFDMESNLVGDKAWSVVFNTDKLKRSVPGCHARVRFDEGVRRTVDYILAHPEEQVADPEFDAWCDRIVDIMDEAKKKIQKLEDE